jgi:hypothetical protein
MTQHRNEKGTAATVPSQSADQANENCVSHTTAGSTSLPFEIRFGGHLWKIEPTTYNGNPRLSIWPHYVTFDGTMKAGRGGLQIPFDDLCDFIEAVKESARRLGVQGI